jgi:hypothetical protein
MLACFNSQPSAAQNVESLVMPGEVISGHADVEEDCSSCHKRFNRSEQNVLCIACHEDVGDDIDTKSGFHGKFSDVSGNTCASCHVDHDGRSADITGLNEATFDHEFTNFELLGKHAETGCDGCHQSDDKHRAAPDDCIGCHLEDNIHNDSLGTECADCHNETDWLDVTFDHDTTDYSLIGSHLEVACIDCHEDKSFQFTSTTCVGCHAEDDVHEGRSGDQCDNCHNPTLWTDSSFDHARDTDFELLGNHALLTCDDCHSDDPFDDELEMECIGCHREDDDHEGHHGTECAHCHTNEEWPAIHFAHNTDTEFELHGSHPTVACIDCHVEPIFDSSPGSACASCHLKDEPHNGKQGDQCNDCHSEESWQEAPFFDHDITLFPLLGEHDNLECESCHDSQIFAGTNSACIDCHAENDPHEGRFENSCGDCHNPVAWDLWLFDHDNQTDFILAGAHMDVGCDICHRGSLASQEKLGNSCADCHRADDVHDGEFGPDCGRCHSDRSFMDVRSLQ